ncbi:MAG: Nudix family hydrolase [Gammaproteobacteria bacterium]
METTPCVHVAAAVVYDRQGRVLVSQRPDHVHQGGLWEFPGGKLETGESPQTGLARELREELGIVMQAARPLIRVLHAYADKSVLLDVWRVTRYSGEPAGLEGQPIDWVAAEKLGERSFPAADIPIIKALNLPERYLITPEPGLRDPQFLVELEQALARGISLVQLRAKSLSAADYRVLVPEVQSVCRAAGARLLLNADPLLAQQLAADGVHLNSARLMAMSERPAGIRLLGASCHTRTEVEHANALAVDFIAVSPVQQTRSHPGAAVLGFEGLRTLTELATVPVYALGGMREADLEMAFRHGAQGIAAISGLWGSFSP